MTSNPKSKEVISKFEFRGIITDMHQKSKGSKSVNEPHTIFTFACSPVDQKKFEDIISKIALGGHCADIHIVTKTLEVITQ